MLNKVLLILLIFLIAFTLRFISIFPDNIIIGFDQARDMLDAIHMFKTGDLRIIGPTAGNSGNLHHGVLYLYYIALPLFFFNANPVAVALINSLFNSLATVAVYLLSKSIFKRELAALFSAILVAFSYQLIQFSGWLSNPTATVLILPLFYLGLWRYFQGKSWGALLASFALGLAIEFELFYLYLIPVILIYLLVFKPKLPSLKLAVMSILVFMAATSTMIATEIKFGFRSIPALLAGGGGEVGFFERLGFFYQKFSDTFAYNLFPQKVQIGPALLILTILVLAILAVKGPKNERKGVSFILLYLLSPLLMVLVGIHSAPWFLIGRPVAIALSVGFCLSKFPKLISFTLLTIIVLANLAMDLKLPVTGQVLLEPDKSALLKTQLRVIDYTYNATRFKKRRDEIASDYKNSQGEFLINTVTNPLYINAVWGYNYYWYGRSKYGYLPHFAGGEQLPPFDTLANFNKGNQNLFLIIDQNSRIPEVHRLEAIKWADSRSYLIEERDFNGILIQKRFFTSQTN